MPYQDIHPRYLRRVLAAIQEKIYEPVASLNVTAWVTPEPVPFEARTSGTMIANLQPGDKWGDLWDCAWMHFEGRVPAEAQGFKVVLLIDVNGELCLVDDEGTPRQGLTNVNSEFDKSLGLPGKRVVQVSECATGNEVIDLWGDAGCNDLFGRFRGGTLREAQIAICHENTRQLYYDFEVLLELAEQLPENSARRAKILQSLYEASRIFMSDTDKSILQARERLAPELSKRAGDPSLQISAVGHAHIDLAWLWPIRETIRKGARTFATALRMMERYPDYVFGASQPQLYAWIKERYPKLYREVTERIREGRWEAQGAMWVEPDTNVPGGESLVRQILYGKRFFQQEFGKDMKILWVPDVFGYSASLPQILKKSGVDYMMTQKLSWNRHNKHPHHSFIWEGIDGSQVLTHMPPEDTYNSPAAPRSIVKAEQNYIDKNVSEHLLMLFGIGDGGGGPGEEHLERLQREKNIQGLTPVIQEPAIQFFEKLRQESHRFKTWRGELYFELHQGTLTSQARNKRYNRKMEKALRELEFASILGWRLLDLPYPAEELEEIWKETLLYQFHDILPGSSITRVYTESLERYDIMLRRVEKMIEERYQRIAQNVPLGDAKDPVVIFNSLPWERTEWLFLYDKWIQVRVPPMGYRVVDVEQTSAVEYEIDADKCRLENELLRVAFNEDGTIGSIFDKENGREVVAQGSKANQLMVYHDDGNAWDFPEDYAVTEGMPMILQDTTVRQDGPVVEIEHVYHFNESVLRQRVVLTAGSKRIDFITQVDWRESGRMLRTSFPTTVHTQEVNCEIQFGYIKRQTHRNTSWDFARDEICAHQWIDLSEPNFGVALLNDSKYGHRAFENVLDINLLRSSSYPDPVADRASHEFTYSVFPHSGDFVDAKVYQAGYELNVPLRIIPVNKGGERLHATFSLVDVDSDHVMVETVKKAEDDDSIVLRLYETSGTQAETDLVFGFAIDSVEVTDLMEAPIEPIDVTGTNRIHLRFTPFEIKTFKVKRLG
ncbi:MAG: alpha-mannosidase [Alicyclobacillus sp.]|nr:alpha-mannosidase [Alicyclobacillus sp.]